MRKRRWQDNTRDISVYVIFVQRTQDRFFHADIHVSRSRGAPYNKYPSLFPPTGRSTSVERKVESRENTIWKFCEGNAAARGERASERAPGSAYLNFTTRAEGQPVCLSGRLLSGSSYGYAARFVLHENPLCGPRIQTSPASWFGFSRIRAPSGYMGESRSHGDPAIGGSSEIMILEPSTSIPLSSDI